MSKYIHQLTNNEIEEFFKKSGYELVKDLTDSDGLPIDAIERSNDDFFARVRKIKRDELDIKFENILMQKSPGFLALSALASLHSAYGNNIDLVHFSDFFMTKFCITEEDETDSQELCMAYIKHMDQKFPTYRADLEKYCESLPDDESIEENEK